MGTTVTLEEKLWSEADFGMFHSYEVITKAKAAELRKEGFIVTDSKDKKTFPRLHRIYWGQAVVKCNNVHALNAKDAKYTFPQQLWITSMQNKNILE